jgi:ubiquinone/menaquinone biosynthesis C-methylase UbiE
MESAELKYTGERLTTERFFTDGAIEHLHRYAFASQLVKDKVVLDIACGEGYGSCLLSKYANFVYGIDIDLNSINHASKKYPKNNLTYIHGSCLEIPIKSNTVDVVVSFETIEHLYEQEQMTIEFKRVLKQDGLLIISSPEKEYYHKVDPNNPFHVKELFLQEFERLIRNNFSFVNFYFQRTKLGSIIIPVDLKPGCYFESSGDFDEVRSENSFKEPIYNLAICSNTKFETDNLSQLNFFRDEHSLVLRMERRVEQVRQKLEYKIGHFILFPYRFLKRIIKWRR